MSGGGGELHLDRDGFHVRPSSDTLYMSWRLYVDGALQAEYDLGLAKGPKDLAAEVRKARAAMNACSIMREVAKEMARLDSMPSGGLPPATRAGAYAAGLEAGLAGEYRVLDASGLPVPPEAPKGVKGGMVFERGWRTGWAINRATAIGAGEPDPADEVARKAEDMKGRGL